MEKLNNGRAKIEITGSQTCIRIPVKRNYFIILFTPVWLIIWFSIINSIWSTFGMFSEDGFFFFFVIWVVLWLLGGLVVFFLLLWNFFGQEKIIIESKHLELNYNLFGHGRKKQYEKHHVINIRFNEISDNIFSIKNRLAFWGLGDGKIKFDYGMNTLSFGLGLDDAEANYIIILMKEKCE